MKTWSTQDWIIRGKTRRSGRNKATTKCGGRSPDAPDWIIPGGTSSRGRRPSDWGIRGQVAVGRPGRAHHGRNKEHRPPSDWIIRGQAAAERHGQDHPGWIKQHEPPHPGLDQAVMQWGKQEAEAEVKVSSSHENKAMEKQDGSQEEEPVVMH